MFRHLAVAASLILAAPLSLRADDADLLRRAQILADGKDWTDAVTVARKSGPLAADIIDWQRLRDGDGRFGEYIAFAARNPDWPGMALLRKEGEAFANDADAGSVMAYFQGHAPQTGTGSLAYIAALPANGSATSRSIAMTSATSGVCSSPPSPTTSTGRASSCTSSRAKIV